MINLKNKHEKAFIPMGVKFWKTLKQMLFLKKKKSLRNSIETCMVSGREIGFRAKLYSQLKSKQMLGLFNFEKLWLSFYYVPQFCQRCRIPEFFFFN